MVKRLFLILILFAYMLSGCGSDNDDPTEPTSSDNIPSELRATFGTYNVTCSTSITKAGGLPEKVMPDKATATIEITASQPGVIGVGPGTIIPGVAPEDVIFGAAYIQNPVHIFMGTGNVNQHGDVVFSGFLADDHRSEAAAANGFSILANHDILGQFVDIYIFDEGATFSLTVSNGAISGYCQGVGRSVVGSEPDQATFRITFDGNKKQ